MSHQPGALEGVRVIELAIGVSHLGGGMAVSVPGMLLADQGATVVRIEGREPIALDAGVEYDRVWNRGKRLCRVDIESAGDRAEVRALMARADVAVVMAAAADLLRLGLEPGQASFGSQLVYCHITQPAVTGEVGGWDALVQAASGLMALPRREREGPVFGDLPTAGFGTALVATAGVLAALFQRERTGCGQLVETSLHDGMVALLGLLLQRVERPTPATEAVGQMLLSYTWLYECADGSWIHLHPGAKGAFDRIEAVLAGGAADSAEGDALFSAPAGDLVGMFERWRAEVARRDRAPLLAEMWKADVPIEPVLEVGDALRHEHVRSTGLSVEQPDPDYGTIIAVGPAVRVRGFAAGPSSGRPGTVDDPAALLQIFEGATTRAGPPQPVDPARTPPLDGVRVLDFGNWLAGPLGDQVLADLGAEVIKVEGLAGDPGRSSDAVHFAGQRGKRSLALDLKSPDAGPVLARLFAWCDVVHHNFRPGVGERLGIDEASVRAVNPDVVYCYSPAYGSWGPKAGMAGFDQMIQAFSGLERAGGGSGGPPMWYPWAPMDTGGGWLSAAAMLLGLYCRVRTGRGQYCESTQLAAGLLAKSGVFLLDDETPARVGPVLDEAQTGFGPGCRIYRAGDGSWVALILRDERDWARLRTLPGMGDVPERYVPLRVADERWARSAERVIERAMADGAAATWVELLAEHEIPSVVVADRDLGGFVVSCFDDQRSFGVGRPSRFAHDSLGWVEVPGIPYRFSGGPLGSALPPPGLGEHSAQVLAEMGLDGEDLARLLSPR